MNDCVIILDTNMDIFHVQSQSTTSLYALTRDTLKPFNLSEYFQPIFEKNIYPLLSRTCNPVNTITLILGTRAGYSDARIVWIWLQSLRLFNPVIPLYVFSGEISYHIAEKLHINGVSYATFKSQCSINPTSFSYLREAVHISTHQSK